MLPEITSQRLNVDRRDILKMGLTGLLGAIVPLVPARNAWAKSNYDSWKISFRHSHTGESFSGVYRVGDRYLPEAFERINYVLRDFRTEEVFPMDPHTIDILALIHKKMGLTEGYETLSGYRSPKTNAMLRHTGTGVAKNSFHMYGQAIDFRVPGRNTSKLRNTAKTLKAGGVGYYPNSNFVHVDTGSVRSW
ncbi:MAG: DUF882 domain-containing protein [Alphaproteobacteria bacterium]|nr:DUF882 domain-containing protein [Alphaproteobacteria bacterium]